MVKILNINPDRPDLELLQEVAEVILKNGVIGYPTETVYGLGANALSDIAVEKVFELKGRERNKPILIISSDIEQVKSLVSLFPEKAAALASTFWPGALTMVLKADPRLSRLLLGGGNQVGIRIPGNKICLELLKRCGVPITSTSANISGQKNPISAHEVLENFGDKLDLIIDGGKSLSRVPSTVVVVEEDTIKLIREGAIPKFKIEQVIGSFADEKETR
jgi:L-threonylcarbamoyladenylate synthase